MQFLPEFRSLADNYDGFILDLWGVIHDGVTPYPGAINSLTQLRSAGKKVILLSNAPRRAYVAQQALRGMGIADDLYTGIMTSGEAVHQALATRTAPWFAALGPRVFHLGKLRDRNVIENLPLTLADTPDQADFVLNTGVDDIRSGSEPEPYDDLLAACFAAGLPMICANPDLEVIADGKRAICAGLLAQRYEALGGIVRSLGKPHLEIYQPVLGLLGLERHRVLAVGDALRTDIAGATTAGIDSCWVLGGIHGEELGGDPAKIKAAAHEAGLSPVACVPSFAW